jgi:hypothetical protein
MVVYLAGALMQSNRGMYYTLLLKITKKRHHQIYHEKYFFKKIDAKLDKAAEGKQKILSIFLWRR